MKKPYWIAASIIILVIIGIYCFIPDKIDAELRTIGFIDENEVQFELINHGKALQYPSWMNGPPGQVELNVKGQWTHQGTGGTSCFGPARREIGSGNSIFFTKKPFIKEGKWRVTVYLYEEDKTPQWLKSTYKFFNMNISEPQILELVSEEFEAINYDNLPQITVERITD